MSSVYERGISIISKPCDKRDDAEINTVLVWFVNLFKKKVAVFGDISNEVVLDIIKNCNFETKKRDDIVIKQGDVGDCFYVILRGKVSIYINHKQHDESEEEDDEDDDEEEDNHDGEQNSGDFTSSSTDFGSASNTEIKYTKIRETLGSFVTSLETGEGFGEYALVSDDRRSASIITDETTDLMVVNKALYRRCLQAPALRRLAEKQAFINQSAFFGNWSQKMKKLLSLCLERDIVPRDSYLGKQGEKADKIYFITKGQAKIVVDPTVHDLQYPKHFSTGQDGKIAIYNAEEYNANINKFNLTEKYRKDSQPIRRRSYTFAEAEKRLKIKHIEVGILGAGEICGMCEIVLGMETYMNSIKCIENCDVFFIYKRSYDRLVKKRNQASIKKMKDYLYLKLVTRNKRLENLHPVPLYGILENKLKIELLTTKPTNNQNSQTNRFKFHLPPAGPIIQQDTRRKSKVKNNNKKLDKNVSYNIYETTDLSKDENTKSIMHESSTHESLSSNSDYMIAQNSEKLYDIDAMSDRALNDLEERIRQWHYENGCKNPLFEHLHRVDLEKLQNVKSGGKIVLKAATKPLVSTTSMSFGGNIIIDGFNSERSNTNTESDDDADYNYGLKSAGTRQTSSKTSRPRVMFFERMNGINILPNNQLHVNNTHRRFSIQYDQQKKVTIEKIEETTTDIIEIKSKFQKRHSLPATRIPKDDTLSTKTWDINEIEKKKRSSVISYIDNPYIVPMQCSAYLFRKLSMNQLKVLDCSKNYSKKEYLLLKDELKKQTRRHSISR